MDTGSEAYTQGLVVDGLARLGREQETLEEIQRYLRTMEAAGKHPVYGKIANALYLFGRREEALEYWQRDVAAAPLDAGKLRSLGDYCELLDEPEEEAFWRARAEALRKTSGPQTQPWLSPG